MFRLRRYLCAILLALSAASRAEVTVTDATGEPVTLSRPAQRIVSLSPHITEQLFTIGAGPAIVATVEWSDYPEPARALPRVGSSGAINLEVLLRHNPDLVIAWRSGNGDQVIERLRALGLKVYVQEPRHLADIATEIVRLGELTGRGAEARAAADDFRGRIDELRVTFSYRRPVRVFQQIWNRPMISLNGEHLVSDVIRLCGGRNIFADAPTLVVNTSLESVVLANPQVIVVSEADGVPPDWMREWQQWPGIDAVANDQLYVINPDLLHRHTLRIAEGAELMCRYIDKARQLLD